MGTKHSSRFPALTASIRRFVIVVSLLTGFSFCCHAEETAGFLFAGLSFDAVNWGSLSRFNERLAHLTGNEFAAEPFPDFVNMFEFGWGFVQERFGFEASFLQPAARIAVPTSFLGQQGTNRVSLSTLRFSLSYPRNESGMLSAPDRYIAAIRKGGESTGNKIDLYAALAAGISYVRWEFSNPRVRWRTRFIESLPAAAGGYLFIDDRTGAVITNAPGIGTGSISAWALALSLMPSLNASFRVNDNLLFTGTFAVTYLLPSPFYSDEGYRIPVPDRAGGVNVAGPRTASDLRTDIITYGFVARLSFLY